MMGTFAYPIEVISADGDRSETVRATRCLPDTLE